VALGKLLWERLQSILRLLTRSSIVTRCSRKTALGIGKFDVLESLGQAIGDVVKDEPEPVLIIASSDMNHYENDKITRVKDHKAIEKILAMDARGLFDVVMNEDISMCGFGPTVAMLTAAKRLGASAAELIKYATSGDISGDREMVVGYAGIVVR
jgi:AmmeMemoRadiSam system protein B